MHKIGCTSAIEASFIAFGWHYLYIEFLHRIFKLMAQVNNHLVIMAGGIGSRIWPLSTTGKPKQFIDILGVGRSLLQLTYDRFAGICPNENIWVVTNRDYAQIVREQLPEIPAENVLLEPCRRNTAACIA